MKLFRFGQIGAEKPGLLLPDGRRVDASSCVSDYNEAFFAGDGMQRLQHWLESSAHTAPEVPADSRLGSPVARPSMIIFIGFNFRKHAVESGMEIPKEPVVFFKATSALCGPNDDVLIPPGSEKTDWEVELALVIGKRTAHVTPEQAVNHIAGYSVLNDYSERAFQLERGGQWVKGKSADTFAPLGPYLVTADEIADVHNLRLWLTVNGKMVQDGNTSDLIFQVPFIVSYLSRFMSLLPGDVITTGTPAGVGAGMKPPVFLKEGDVVELGIDGLGSSKQKAVQCRLPA